MSPTDVPAVEVNQAESASHTVVPEWLNEEYFVDVLEENVEGFRRILNFEAAPTGGGGENYASILVRVKVKVELQDDSTKDEAYIIKTIPQEEQGAIMVRMMGLFPKEIEMYTKLLSEFEQMYRDVGKTVRFGPKFFEFKKKTSNEYVLLEDISPRGFKNTNRLEGLDEEQILSVLKIVAELHAASAVRYETGGEYGSQFTETIFSEKNREMLEAMGKKFQSAFMNCLSARPNADMYIRKLEKLQDVITDILIKANLPDLDDFNVLIHGDLWANNIMFRYNDQGCLEDTLLIDFQMTRYASPVVDLFYFLMSSTKLELKVACFDKFVKFYHEQLSENLRLLRYPKKILTLRDLHMQILKRGVLGFSAVTSIMPLVLMDPNEDADMGKFLNEGEESQSFQQQMYINPRFLKHLDVVMEWLDLRGFLD